MATGRTTAKRIIFIVDDSGGTIRALDISSVSAVGLVYETQDVTAYADAVKGALNGHPDAPITITGPVDNTASTGNHIVLSGIAGGVTPLTLDVQFGIQSTWSSGDPQFGITSSATNGYLCTSYVVNGDMTFEAQFVLFPGSIAPAWGTAAET